MTDETTTPPAPRSRRRTVLRVVLASALVLALVTGVGTDEEPVFGVCA